VKPRPHLAGRSKTDLRRGRIRSGKPCALTPATTSAEQEFLFPESAHSPADLKKNSDLPQAAARAGR
jgi:hypothetical protein